MKYKGWIIGLIILLLITGYMLSLKQESYDVIVILKNRFLTEYWREVKFGIETAKENHDIKVSYLAAESESDVEGQKLLILDAIESKPDAILLAANDFSELADHGKMITDAGIKLIMIDSGIDYEGVDCFVATDNYLGGYQAGEKMASLVEENAKVMIMNYSRGSQTAIDRQNGAVKALEDSNKNIEYTTYYCYDDIDEASRITSYVIEDSGNISGVISLNETSSNGVARSIDELGLLDDVHVVAYDSSKEEIQFLEKGVIDALVVQKPFNMGYVGLEVAVKVLNGENVEPFIDTGSKLILRENMFDKENVDLLFPFEE